MRFCNSCNALLREDENFCHKCGSKVQADDDYDDGFFSATDKSMIDFSPLIDQEKETRDNNIYSHSQDFDKEDDEETNDEVVNESSSENQNAAEISDSAIDADVNNEESRTDFWEPSPFTPPIVQEEPAPAQENPFNQPEQVKFRKVCPNCNQPLNNGQSVCPYCGYDIARYNDDYDSPIDGEYQTYVPQNSYTPMQKKSNRSKTAIIVCSIIATVVVVVAAVMIFVLPNIDIDSNSTAPTAAATATEIQTETETETEPPTEEVTDAPTETPTEAPTEVQTEPPTEAPTVPPTEAPTESVTEAPTEPLTEAPTNDPAIEPSELIL